MLTHTYPHIHTHTHTNPSQLQTTTGTLTIATWHRCGTLRRRHRNLVRTSCPKPAAFAYWKQPRPRHLCASSQSEICDCAYRITQQRFQPALPCMQAPGANRFRSVAVYRTHVRLSLNCPSNPHAQCCPFLHPHLSLARLTPLHLGARPSALAAHLSVVIDPPLAPAALPSLPLPIGARTVLSCTGPSRTAPRRAPPHARSQASPRRKKPYRLRHTFSAASLKQIGSSRCQLGRTSSPHPRTRYHSVQLLNLSAV